MRYAALGGGAVLGLSAPAVRTEDVPVEMCVSRQKMRPGSGFLAVKVLTDGPTRVLQVTDIRQQVGATPTRLDALNSNGCRSRPSQGLSEDAKFVKLTRYYLLAMCY